MTAWDRIKAWVVARWKWLVLGAAALLAILRILFKPKDQDEDGETTHPDTPHALRTAEAKAREEAAARAAAEAEAGRRAAEEQAAAKLREAEAKMNAAVPEATSSAEAANRYADQLTFRDVMNGGKKP